jgi:hypothetical protein
MVEFRGVQIDYVEAKREKEAVGAKIDINIDVDDVRANGEDIIVHFNYIANYEGVGFLKVGGVVYARDTAASAKKLEATWKAERKFPQEFAQPMLNLINFSAGVNSVLVAKAVNLVPPLMPQRIEMTNNKPGAAKR